MTTDTQVPLPQAIDKVEMYLDTIRKLELMRSSIEADQGITKQTAVNLEALSPGFLAETGGLNSFTSTLSKANYQASLESLLSKTKHAIVTAVGYLVDLIKRIVRWVVGLWDAAVAKVRNYRQRKEAASVLEQETANILRDLPSAQQNTIRSIIQRMEEDADQVLSHRLEAFTNNLFWSFFHNDEIARTLVKIKDEYGSIVNKLETHMHLLGQLIATVKANQNTAPILQQVELANEGTAEFKTEFAHVHHFVKVMGQIPSVRLNSPGYVYRQYANLFMIHVRQPNIAKPTAKQVLGLLHRDLDFTVDQHAKEKLAKTVATVNHFFDVIETLPDVERDVSAAIKMLIEMISKDMSAVHSFNEVNQQLIDFSERSAEFAYTYRQRIYDALITHSLKEPMVRDAVERHMARVKEQMKKIMGA